MGLKRVWASACVLSVLAAATCIFAGKAVFGQSDPPVEVYFATPHGIPESQPAPVDIVGVFPVGAGIESIEAAEEAYRVYLGTAPWTEDHVAPFRVGPDDYVVTPDDGIYANEIRVTTPAFSPPGWLDLEIIDLENMSTAAWLYDAVEVMSFSGEGEGEGEGGF